MDLYLKLIKMNISVSYLFLLAKMHSDSMLLCYMFSIMIFIIILGTVLYVEQHKKIILSLEFLKLAEL